MKTVAMLLLMTSIAAAQPKPDKARAREFYYKGTQHYNLGEWNEALDAFKEAYRSYPEPSFLYNLAQCYRQVHNFDQAALMYRSYIREAPNADNVADARKLLAEMEKAVQEQHASQPPTGTKAPAGEKPASETSVVKAQTSPTPILVSSPPPPAKQSSRGWVWGVVIGSVAVVGIGLGVGLGVGLSGSHAPSASFGTWNLQ
jgi:hypothetical protein